MRSGFTKSSTIPPVVEHPSPRNNPAKRPRWNSSSAVRTSWDKRFRWYPVPTIDRKSEATTLLLHTIRTDWSDTLWWTARSAAKTRLNAAANSCWYSSSCAPIVKWMPLGVFATVRSRSLGDVAFGDVPAEDEAKVVGLLDIAIHRHELDVVALLAAVLQVCVHLADEPVDFFVFAGADVVHQVVHAPLASFERRCGHDEIRGMNVLGSQPHESVERVGTVTVDERFAPRAWSKRGSDARECRGSAPYARSARYE